MRVEAEELRELRRILSFWAAGIPVYAYGSRVHGRGFKATSDLDLCLRGEKAVGAREVQRLRDAFMLSDLPYRVEVVDWHDLSEDFRRVIGKDLEPVVGMTVEADAG